MRLIEKSGEVDFMYVVLTVRFVDIPHQNKPRALLMACSLVHYFVSPLVNIITTYHEGSYFETKFPEALWYTIDDSANKNNWRIVK